MDDIEVQHLLSQADRQLGRLDAAETRRLGGRKVIRALYAHPLIDAEGVAKATGLSLPSAYKLIGDMEELGILEEITGAKRGRIYRFERYVQIFRG